jgi:hypothetical protein
VIYFGKLEKLLAKRACYNFFFKNSKLSLNGFKIEKNEIPTHYYIVIHTSVTCVVGSNVNSLG